MSSEESRSNIGEDSELEGQQGGGVEEEEENISLQEEEGQQEEVFQDDSHQGNDQGHELLESYESDIQKKLEKELNRIENQRKVEELEREEAEKVAEVVEYDHGENGIEGDNQEKDERQNEDDHQDDHQEVQEKKDNRLEGVINEEVNGGRKELLKEGEDKVNEQIGIKDDQEDQQRQLVDNINGQGNLSQENNEQDQVKQHEEEKQDQHEEQMNQIRVEESGAQQISQNKTQEGNEDLIVKQQSSIQKDSTIQIDSLSNKSKQEIDKPNSLTNVQKSSQVIDKTSNSTSKITPIPSVVKIDQEKQQQQNGGDGIKQSNRNNVEQKNEQQGKSKETNGQNQNQQITKTKSRSTQNNNNKSTSEQTQTQDIMVTNIPNQLEQQIGQQDIVIKELQEELHEEREISAIQSMEIDSLKKLVRNMQISIDSIPRTDQRQQKEQLLFNQYQLKPVPKEQIVQEEDDEEYEDDWNQGILEIEKKDNSSSIYLSDFQRGLWIDNVERMVDAQLQAHKRVKGDSRSEELFKLQGKDKKKIDKDNEGGQQSNPEKATRVFESELEKAARINKTLFAPKYKANKTAMYQTLLDELAAKKQAIQLKRQLKDTLETQHIQAMESQSLFGSRVSKNVKLNPLASPGKQSSLYMLKQSGSVLNHSNPEYLGDNQYFTSTSTPGKNGNKTATEQYNPQAKYKSESVSHYSNRKDNNNNIDGVPQSAQDMNTNESNINNSFMYNSNLSQKTVKTNPPNNNSNNINNPRLSPAISTSSHHQHTLYRNNPTSSSLSALKPSFSISANFTLVPLTPLAILQSKKPGRNLSSFNHPQESTIPTTSDHLMLPQLSQNIIRSLNPYTCEYQTASMQQKTQTQLLGTPSRINLQGINEQQQQQQQLSQPRSSYEQFVSNTPLSLQAGSSPYQRVQQQQFAYLASIDQAQQQQQQQMQLSQKDQQQKQIIEKQQKFHSPSGHLHNQIYSMNDALSGSFGNKEKDIRKPSSTSELDLGQDRNKRANAKDGNDNGKIASKQKFAQHEFFPMQAATQKSQKKLSQQLQQQQTDAVIEQAFPLNSKKSITKINGEDTLKGNDQKSNKDAVNSNNTNIDSSQKKQQTDSYVSPSTQPQGALHKQDTSSINPTSQTSIIHNENTINTQQQQQQQQQEGKSQPSQKSIQKIKTQDRLSSQVNDHPTQFEPLVIVDSTHPVLSKRSSLSSVAQQDVLQKRNSTVGSNNNNNGQQGQNKVTDQDNNSRISQNQIKQTNSINVMGQSQSKDQQLQPEQQPSQKKIAQITTTSQNNLDNNGSNIPIIEQKPISSIISNSLGTQQQSQQASQQNQQPTSQKDVKIENAIDKNPIIPTQIVSQNQTESASAVNPLQPSNIQKPNSISLIPQIAIPVVVNSTQNQSQQQLENSNQTSKQPLNTAGLASGSSRVLDSKGSLQAQVVLSTAPALKPIQIGQPKSNGTLQSSENLKEQQSNQDQTQNIDKMKLLIESAAGDNK